MRLCRCCLIYLIFNNPQSVIALWIFKIATILKRLMWICLLKNLTNNSNSKACVKNFAKIYLSCWSSPWSHLHTRFARLSKTVILVVLNTNFDNVYFGIKCLRWTWMQRCWLGSGSVSHGAINLVARATVTTQMSGRRKVTWSAECKGLKTRVVLDLTFIFDQNA